MTCDLKRHEHRIPNTYLSPRGELVFDSTGLVKAMKEVNHISRAITCDCGAVEIGTFRLYIEEPAVREGHNSRVGGPLQ